MLFKPEPLTLSIKAAKKNSPKAKTILLSPQGEVFNQSFAKKFSLYKDGYIIVCARYEGVDERVLDIVDYEISIGDFVMTGGELAAMMLIDAVTRLIPGSLGAEDSAEKDSFMNGLIEHAHYTRPENFEGKCVPDVLLSGNHKKIEEWRLESSLKRTFLKKSDLFEKRIFSKQEIEILKKWHIELGKIIHDKS
jgi:tRNA (guanine37-N1)-methyltransferase